jgi:hypothetical protein
VEYNNETYAWALFVPMSRMGDLSVFLDEMSPHIQADIDAKEAAWAALDPKTRERPGLDPDNPTIVPIEKSEIVCADIPDYFANRMKEYPSLSDQLDAFWKGADSAAFQAMQARIQAVKAKYPKPAWVTTVGGY